MKFILAQDNTLKLKLPKLTRQLNSLCTSVKFEHLKLDYQAPDELISCPKTHSKYLRNIKPSLGDQDYILLITDTQYDNNYFYEEEKQLIIISFFGWPYFTSLPAENGLVYFICGILMDFVIPWDAVEHKERLGCVNDFLMDKTRVDDGMRKGHLCPACRERLQKNPPDEASKAIYSDVQQILGVLSMASSKEQNFLSPPNPEMEEARAELESIPDPAPAQPVRNRPAIGKGTQVFISYAHEDEKYKDKLLEHLSMLQRLGMISTWNDRMIEAGEKYENVINENLNKSGIIIMLISASFIASDYCYGIEMKTALEREEKDEAVAISVILKDCLWDMMPFAKLLVLPKDGKPVQRFTRKDEAYTSVARAIAKLIEGN
ncbi:MAG: toll/interleukin-1 receptor domain-containing protein [Bacteroidetes bacterium]|nr:toll/interleukin-1 receptor domain-containing protein [Bacteroidota bacterium]